MTNPRNSLKDFIKLEDIDVVQLSTDIRNHAAESKTEEDLRIRVESTLRPILEEWGIQWATYEHSNKISGIRKDALYGTVIIEYKAPQKLESKREFEKGKEQLKKYIAEEAMDPQYYGRYFGILIDGFKIAFIRYRKNDWEEPDVPLDVTPRTVLRILEAIRGLQRKAIDAEELLKDFGPKSPLSKSFILKLYHSISNPTSPRSLMLFEDWRRMFSQVCAYSIDKMKKLINYYDLKDKKDVDVERLMYAVHTYYTLLMKLLTSEVVTIFSDSLLGSYLKRLEESYYKSSDDMYNELKDLESGGIFSLVGIKNFLEADYFAWYLDEWDEEIAKFINEIVKKLLNYEPATVELNPERVRDLFKRLYQNLVPRDIRHKLGEFFTPDWLAELVLDEVGYYGELEKSILDPACGSGTFLVLAIKRIKEFADDRFISKKKTLEIIINNVKGIDLNPLAVLASKANYLIALSDLLRDRPTEGFEIPIYLADSISVSQRRTITAKRELFLTTTVGEFKIPYDIIDKKLLDFLLNKIEKCIISQDPAMSCTKNEFKQIINRDFNDLDDENVKSIVELYDKILNLEKEGKNRIWVKLLKNSFAPILIGQFDFVVGNPPWINWENLPKNYRDETSDLWERYGLLEKTKGIGMGKTKRDMAMLFTTRSLDRFVKIDGKYAFLIPFTSFKSQTGAGFRRFLAEGKKISKNYELPCKLLKTHDLVELYPFEGAVNRTAMFVIEKAGKTEFPISCTVWHNPTSKGMPMDASLEEVEKITKHFDMEMMPIKPKKVETPWMIGTKESNEIVNKIIGESPSYEAHAGVYTAFNQIFWIDLLSDKPDGLMITNPIRSGQKKSTKVVKHLVEKDLIFPMIRGRNIKKWYTVKDIGSIILPVDDKGDIISDSNLKVNYEKSYNYFLHFFDDLINRGAQPYKSKLKPYREKSFDKAVQEAPPFYWIFNVSTSMAPYKVAWKEIAGKISGKAEFSTVVIEPGTFHNRADCPIIPDHKVIFIPFHNKNEAHYVSAILNSSIVYFAVSVYTIETTMDPHIMKTIRVEKFNSTNPIHIKLSKLSQKAHKISTKIVEENREDLKTDLEDIEEEINKLIGILYGFNEKDYKEIKKALLMIKEGEIPEGEEEEIEAILPTISDPLEINIDPLLVSEKKSERVVITIKNNYDKKIKDLNFKFYLLKKLIFEYNLDEVPPSVSHELSFNLQELKKGQYKLKFSLNYKLGKEKKTYTDKRNLFVKEQKMKKAKKSKLDEELDELLGD